MLTVLFDHQKFTTQRYGGISRYFANLLHSIGGDPGMDYKLGVLYCENHYIGDINLPARNAVSKVMFRKKQSLFYRLNEQYSARLVEKNQFNVFHPTYYDTYFFGKLKKPFVTTIHDMTYERLPQYFWAHDDLTFKKRQHIERADHIIAISETTKADLLAYSNADPAKISVIYHGIDLDTPANGTPVNGLPPHYILFVGDRGGYKNFYTFMNAFKQVSTQYEELKVVLSGGGSLAIADREFIFRLGLQDKVLHYHVSDEELHYLYQNALLFVYPSLHEGFGYPILEAFRADCAILLSDTPCFREIAADAALFFEAGSAEDLAEKMKKMVDDSALRKNLIGKGATRLYDFPLNRSIKQTLNLYKSFS
jgi:glycosyltransferase involved in cell wall biosynthesis